MAKEIDAKLDKPVIAILKQDSKPGEKVEAMVKAGVPRNQVALFMYRNEHLADPSLKLPATPKSIRNARENDKLRFERIAYRTGLVEKEGSLGAAIAKAKELMKQAGGDPDGYVGRGRRFDGSSPEKPATSGRRGAAKEKNGTSGRRGAAKPATSGRRGAAAKEPVAAGGRGKRGTRAQADPS